MVIPDLTNPVLAPIVRGIEEVLWEAELGCLLADTGNDPEREATLIGELRARRCEGMIVATVRRSSPVVDELAVSGPPTVLVTRSTDDRRLPFVAGDDATGVAHAVRHVVEQGHRRIVHLSGPPHFSTTVRREAAYRQAMTALLPDAQQRVVYGEGFTIDTGRTHATTVLGGDPPPTAVLCGNDMIAIGLYEALADQGLRCPADLSVVGHNDMPFMSHVAPPLTTVSIPQRRVGIEAARVLLTLLAGDLSAPTTLLPTTLVVRGSTAPPTT